MNWTDEIKRLHLLHGGSTKRIDSMETLYPPFRARVEAALEKMRDKGMHPRVFETFRTDDLQAHYYAKGASKIKKRGMHGYGMAVDIIHETLLWEAPLWWWQDMRQIANEAGLFTPFTWDMPHIQAVPYGLQGDVRMGVYPWADELEPRALRPEHLQIMQQRTIPALSAIYDTAEMLGLSAQDEHDVFYHANKINQIYVNAGLKK